MKQFQQNIKESNFNYTITIFDSIILLQLTIVYKKKKLQILRFKNISRKEE